MLLATNVEKRLYSVIDDKSLVVLEYHLNQYGASLQRIFYDSAKLDMALKEIFGEGSTIIVKAMTEGCYEAFGLLAPEGCVDNGFHSDHLTATIESLWRWVTNE